MSTNKESTFLSKSIPWYALMQQDRAGVSQGELICIGAGETENDRNSIAYDVVEYHQRIQAYVQETAAAIFESIDYDHFKEDSEEGGETLHYIEQELYSLLKSISGLRKP